MCRLQLRLSDAFHAAFIPDAGKNPIHYRPYLRPSTSSTRVHTYIRAREHTKTSIILLSKVIWWYCTYVTTAAASENTRTRAVPRNGMPATRAFPPAARVGAGNTASTSEPPSITTGFIFSSPPPQPQQWRLHTELEGDIIVVGRRNSQHPPPSSPPQPPQPPRQYQSAAAHDGRLYSCGHALIRYGFYVIFTK